MGPTNPISEKIHAEKHRGAGESFRDAMIRQASTLSDGNDHYHAYKDIISERRYLAAGRIQSSIGSLKNTTAFNCYVSGTINDSFVDGHGSIMQRASEAAATMRMGGGIGYDFSGLRPRGARIRKLQSSSSGPISFMHIYDAICKCVASSGHRRGAQMGVMRCDHPDIEAFIHAKQDQTTLTGFNISVALTDHFMSCVKQDTKSFPLVFKGETESVIDPTILWDMLMRSTYDWGEPGCLFIDRINELNNLYYCETIAATNPCGEQPLPPYGACLLGSFNWTQYLKGNDGGAYFDIEKYKADIPHVVRAMDNVIERTNYPLYEQKEEAHAKRRMGLGVTGVANTLELMGFAYGSDGFIEQLDTLLKIHTNECYRASALLAKEKGAFPMYDRDKYMDSKFVARLDPDVRDLIAKHGVRNSHLTSIAPTGTISLCTDNISSGIEPVAFHKVDRDVIDATGEKKNFTLEDWAVANHNFYGATIPEVSVNEHVAVLATSSHWMDSAVSKTCNVPHDIEWDDFKNVYLKAWELGCKGITTYRTGCKREAVIKKAVEPSQCVIDPDTGRKECSSD